MKRSIAVLFAVVSLIGSGRAFAQEAAPGPGRVEISLIPGGFAYFTEQKDTREPSFGNYDLGGALAVNFNTINAVRKGKTVSSAEPQTPITPLAISQFRARGPQGRGRISLTQNPAVGLQYAGELIVAFIERAMAKNPDERYQTGEEFAAALRKAPAAAAPAARAAAG